MIWNIDIVFITDEVNVLVPRREIRVEIPPMGENLANTIDHYMAIIPSYWSTQILPRPPLLILLVGPLEIRGTNCHFVHNI